MATKEESLDRAREASARNRRETKIAELIRSAPPFTPEQTSRLRSLLSDNAALWTVGRTS